MKRFTSYTCPGCWGCWSRDPTQSGPGTLLCPGTCPHPRASLPPLLPGLRVMLPPGKPFLTPQVWGKDPSSILPENTWLLLPGHQSHGRVSYSLGHQVPCQSLQGPLVLAGSAECDGFDRHRWTQEANSPSLRPSLGRGCLRVPLDMVLQLFHTCPSVPPGLPFNPDEPHNSAICRQCN